MSEQATTNLPWVCPEHPDSEIRHVWKQNHWEYKCAICGRCLAPPPEEPDDE